MTRNVRIKLAAGLAALILAFIGGPMLIGWNGFKDPIAARVLEATGRRLTIDGDLSLALLPRPTLSAIGVRLSNLDGAVAPDMVAADAVHIRLGLGGLLGGRLDVVRVDLVRPLIRLESLSDGRVNWRFDGRPARQGMPPASVPPVRDTGDKVVFAIDNIVIDGGRIVFRHGTDESTVAERIDVDLAAEALAGPYSAGGKLTVRGMAMQVQARVGILADGRASQLTLEANPIDGGGSLRFSGLMSGQAADASLRGRVVATGDNLPRLAGALGVPDVLGFEQPFKLAGVLSTSTARIALEDVDAEIGGGAVTGRLVLSLAREPELEVALRARDIDLDRWLAPPPRKPAGGGRGVEAAAPVPSASAPLPPPRLVLPEGIAMNLDLAADSVVWHGGRVRNVRASLALARGELAINQASARLPGNAELALFGFLAARDGLPQVDLSVETSAENVRETLTWLGADLPQAADSHLRKAAGRARITGGPADLKVTRFDFTLDATHASGAATFRLLGRPALAANIIVDTLDLDAYFPVKAAPPVDPAQPGVAPRKGKGVARIAATSTHPLLAAFAALRPLNDFDANLRTRVTRLVLRDHSLRDVSLDAILVGGVLRVREAAVASVASVSGSFSGAISGFGGRPALDNIAFTISTRDAARAAQAFKMDLPTPPGGPAIAAATGTLSGNTDRLALDVRTELGGATLVMKGDLIGLTEAPSADLVLEASHANFAGFVNLFDDAYQPQGGRVGGFAFQSRAGGPLMEMTFHDMRARLGQAVLTGTGTLSLAGPRPKVTASLAAGDIVIDPLLPSEDHRRGPPRLAEDTLLKELSNARAPGGGVAAEAAAAAAKAAKPVAAAPAKRKPPAKGGKAKQTGKKAKPAPASARSAPAPVMPAPTEPVSASALPPPPSAAPVRKVVVARSPGEWSDIPFDFWLLQAVDGDVTLEASSITWSGWRLADARVKTVLARGTAHIERMDGSFLGGALAARGRVDASRDLGFALTVTVVDASVRQALARFAGMRVVDGNLAFEADLAGSGTSPRTMVDTLSGSMRLTVRDGAVQGLDLAGVNQRLSRGGDAVGLFTALQEGVGGGSTRFSSLAGVFTMADGIVATDGLKLVADPGQALGIGRASLPNWVLDGRIEFRLAARPDAPPLTLRLSGPLGDPKKVFDIQGLQRHLLSRGGSGQARGGRTPAVEPTASVPLSDGKSAVPPLPREQPAPAPLTEAPKPKAKSLFDGWFRR